MLWLLQYAPSRTNDPDLAANARAILRRLGLDGIRLTDTEPRWNNADTGPSSG